MKASLIICTHNRVESLVRTLKAVTLQNMSVEDFEVLVVDNASTDGTKSAIERLAKEVDFHLRYHYEPRLGLSYARNTGVANSQGEIVVFTDDDAIPRDSWLKNITDVFCDRSVGAAGGDVYPVWPDGSCPAWLHPSLYEYIGLVQFHSLGITDLLYPNFPFGVNIAFRKCLVEFLEGFSSELGRSGESLLSGEETELCARLTKEGQRVVYVPDAIVEHLIAKERLSKEWFRRRAGIQGVSKAKIEFDEAGSFRKGGLCLRRISILLGSMIGFLVASVFQEKIAFVCESKMRMSAAYLAHVFKLHRQNGGEVS